MSINCMLQHAQSRKICSMSPSIRFMFRTYELLLLKSSIKYFYPVILLCAIHNVGKPLAKKCRMRYLVSTDLDTASTKVDLYNFLYEVCCANSKCSYQ